ncbi:MAG TPA: hypothetical protein PKY81_14465 [bacterium]|nr:hypothetical protein [bacterium]
MKKLFSVIGIAAGVAVLGIAALGGLLFYNAKKEWEQMAGDNKSKDAK